MSTAVGKDDGKSGFVSVGTTELTSGIKTPKDAFGAFEAVFVTCCQLAGSLTFSGSLGQLENLEPVMRFSSFTFWKSQGPPPNSRSRSFPFAGFRVQT